MSKNSVIKLLALLLSLVMVLAACGSSGDKTSSEASTSEPAASTEQSKEESKEEPVEEEKISSEERVLTLLISDNPNQPKRNNAPAQEEIFKRTNIRLDYQIVPSSNYSEKKSILLSTNNMPDIAKLDKSDIIDYAPSGIFLNLTEYIDDLPNFKALWDTYPDMAKSMIDGELYAFQVVAKNEATNGFGPAIRTDLLTKHDLEVPTSFDELLDVLEALKTEYPDSRPYTGRNGTNQLLRTTAYQLGSGHQLYFDHDLDKYVYGPATEEFKEVLRFHNQAFERKVLDMDYATSTAEQFETRLVGGQSFFFNDNSGFSLNFTNTLREIEPDAKLEAIHYLTNSFGQRRAVSYATEIIGSYYAINGGVEDPETVVRFMDWMYGEEGSDISNYGVEGVSFQYNDEGKPEFIEEYVMQFKDHKPAGYYGVFSDMGITKLDFSLYAGNTEQTFEIQRIQGFWDEETEAYWERMAEEVAPGGALVQPVADPPFTVEEAEKIKQLTLDLNTMLEQEYDKYIMGVEPIENWDKVIEKANEIGAVELVELYNSVNEAFLASAK